MFQARVCVQNHSNGDVQGFLYMNDGNGEQLITTTARFASSSAQAASFTVSGSIPPTSGGGTFMANANVDVSNRQVAFTIDFPSGSGTTTSMFSRHLQINNSPC